MVYQHLPNPSGHSHDRMPAKPRSKRRDGDQEPPVPGEKDGPRVRPGAITLIAGRLIRAFRTPS
jgi:hypothetical protein